MTNGFNLARFFWKATCGAPAARIANTCIDYGVKMRPAKSGAAIWKCLAFQV